MFDIGWSEMAVIAVLALVVLGPKELPGALRAITGLMRQARKLTSEFRSGVNEIIREADLVEAKKTLQAVSKGSIAREIEKTVDPEGALKSALQESEAKAPPPEPIAPAAPPVASADAGGIVGAPESAARPT